MSGTPQGEGAGSGAVGQGLRGRMAGATGRRFTVALTAPGCHWTFARLGMTVDDVLETSTASSNGSSCSPRHVEVQPLSIEGPHAILPIVAYPRIHSRLRTPCPSESLTNR